MKRDQSGKIQSNLDLRAIQERAEVRADIHNVVAPEPQLRRRKPTLLRLQELLREIMKSSDSVKEVSQPQPVKKAPAVVADREEQPTVIYVDSTGLASQKNS